MKKIITFVIALILMLEGIMSVTAHAQEEGKQVVDQQKVMAELLDDYGEFIKEQLYTSVQKCVEQSNNDTFDTIQKSRFINLAGEYQELYNTYLPFYTVYKETGSIENNRAMMNNIFVLMVISWFSSQGYELAAELLTHSCTATTGSSYIPANGYRAKYTSTYSAIMSGNSSSGSAEFPNSGTVYDKDMYYSLHYFNYQKAGTQLIIWDTYDYEPSSHVTIEGLAVDAMYIAQITGVIHTYSVTMTVY